MQTVSTFLWFADRAEEAAGMYVTIVPNSHIVSVSRGEVGPDQPQPGPGGPITSVTFELDGAPFVALNGGPVFTFTPAISLQVSAETQDRIDYYWEALTAGGGQGGQCGWLTDRFGLSWQVVPPQLGLWLSDPDPERAERVRQAMFTMSKLDLGALRAAHEG